MFQSRTYGKAELALLYQPCSSPESAIKTLNRWINRCPQLLEELRGMHYNARRHTFLKPEVEAIVRHLGDRKFSLSKRFRSFFQTSGRFA